MNSLNHSLDTYHHDITKIIINLNIIFIQFIIWFKSIDPSAKHGYGLSPIDPGAKSLNEKSRKLLSGESLTPNNNSSQ